VTGLIIGFSFDADVLEIAGGIGLLLLFVTRSRGSLRCSG
jgi:hypothetical protein